MVRRVVFALVFVAWLLVVSKLLAQPLSAADLVLQTARVSANEGAFKYRYEAALVWQTTRNSAKTDAKRLAWLLRHSARVGGTRPCKVGNCFWTPNLERSAVLPAGLNIPADFWAVRVAPIWLDTLRYVTWMVTGERTSEDPCPVQPRTWGCEADRARALREGLYPVGCRRPAADADDGYALAKDCWRGRWLCDPRWEPAIQSEPPSMYDTSIALRPSKVIR